jgi:hypothetical protein
VTLSKLRRLSPQETRRLIDDYTLYRFGHVLSPQAFAEQSGVAAACVDDLLAQKLIPPDDLRKIARSIDVSADLLSAIAGNSEMTDDSYRSLTEFFEAANAKGRQKAA